MIIKKSATLQYKFIHQSKMYQNTMKLTVKSRWGWMITRSHAIFQLMEKCQGTNIKQNRPTATRAQEHGADHANTANDAKPEHSQELARNPWPNRHLPKTRPRNSLHFRRAWEPLEPIAFPSFFARLSNFSFLFPFFSSSSLFPLYFLFFFPFSFPFLS